MMIGVLISQYPNKIGDVMKIAKQTKMKEKKQPD